MNELITEGIVILQKALLFFNPHQRICLLGFFFLRFHLLIFRETGREGEKYRHARVTWISCLSHAPNWESDP